MSKKARLWRTSNGEMKTFRTNKWIFLINIRLFAADSKSTTLCWLIWWKTTIFGLNNIERKFCQLCPWRDTLYWLWTVLYEPQNSWHKRKFCMGSGSQLISRDSKIHQYKSIKYFKYLKDDVSNDEFTIYTCEALFSFSREMSHENNI